VRTRNRASPEHERADLVHLCTVIIGIERSTEPCGIGVPSLGRDPALRYVVRAGYVTDPIRLAAWVPRGSQLA